MRVLRARALLPRPGAWVEGGGVALSAGRVVAVLPSPRAVARAVRAGAAVEDLGDVLLTPGLVDAHAHLELGGLAGAIPAGTPFGPWVGHVIRLRTARGAEGRARDAARGAERLLATGTTTVGDVDTTGAAERGLAAGPPGPRPEIRSQIRPQIRPQIRLVLFREVLDAHDPARTAGELARVARALPRRARRSEGLAPHAPFTASPRLLAGVARLAARRGAQVSVHWSETADEVRWMTRGEGPLAALLGPSPGQSGLDLLEQAGLLGPRLALVHGNHPARGEIARIAAAGAVLVHCPGTHAYFGREPAPLGRYRRAGVVLALGTDSLASNADLDLRREMRLLLEAQAGFRPAEAWAMGTTGAARALGLAGEVGELGPGARADLVAHGPFEGPRRGAIAELVSGRLGVRAVWVGGRRARLPGPQGRSR